VTDVAAKNWPLPLPPSVNLERRNQIAVVSLNRPEKRNALNDELVLGLQTAFSSVPEDVRAIILTGAGANFSAGLDLNELRETTVVESFRTSKIGQQLNDTVQFCSVPVIAVLQGAVIGGGFELAAAAHVRIAEPSAFYALPEGTRGIFLGSGGTVRLPRLIGASTVIEMMLTGRVYRASEGHQLLRFSHYLADEGQGLRLAMDLAEKIARNAPLANFAILQAIPRIAEQDPASGLFTETLMVGIAQGDEEAKRRLRSFLDLKANKVTRE
jgi:(methylthio)acryloyl-CoA hydratase